MKLLIITGQTATGKTQLALEKGKTLINADSRQIYKHLDIITGKEKSKIKDQKSKIYLYDLVDPKEYFSSFDYQKKALPLIRRLLIENKRPVIVGGTYLYLAHLLYRVETENIPPNWQLREKLTGQPVFKLQNLLKKLSVQAFNRLNDSDKNNPQRLIRKIEILTANKKFVSGYISPKNLALGQKIGFPDLQIEFIGLKFRDKKDLKKAITKRIEERLKQGAIEEVVQLLKKGYTENDPGLKTIGYRQIIQYLKGRLTKEEAIGEWLKKELQYAKRQYTFMKKNPNISWRFI
jgi:tRNA dimethylallyltransferase